MNYDILRIEQALASGNQIRMHQNGFLQLDLLDEVSRLHIWSPELPKAQDPRTPIHNHRFCFKSRVIVGILAYEEYSWINERYFNLLEDADPICELFTGSGDYQNLVGTGIRGTFRPDTSDHYYKGDEYHFPHGKYHDNWAKELTATIMTKTKADCIPFATVVVPLGEGGPDNSFRRDQYPQELLMPFVMGVLTELKR